MRAAWPPWTYEVRTRLGNTEGLSVTIATDPEAASVLTSLPPWTYEISQVPATLGRPIRSFGYILSVFGPKTGPDVSGQPLGFIWTKFQAKWSIFQAIQVIFDDLGPNRHCGLDLDLQDQAGDGPLEWVRPVPKAPERSWHASGTGFRPHR